MLYIFTSSIVDVGGGKFPYMSTVGLRIRKARIEAGLSQGQLGKACGVSRAAVSQWELGTTKSPTSENIFAIAAATGFSPRWLTTERGPERDQAASANAVSENGATYGLPPLHAALIADRRDFDGAQMLALIRAAGHIKDGRKLIPEVDGSAPPAKKNLSPPAPEKAT
jgi:transcriptional regulator with XRE-family HTH domain